MSTTVMQSGAKSVITYLRVLDYYVFYAKKRTFICQLDTKVRNSFLTRALVKFHMLPALTFDDVEFLIIRWHPYYGDDESSIMTYCNASVKHMSWYRL